MRSMTEGREDHDTGQDAGEKVHHGDDVGVHVDTGVKLVVAPEHDDSAPGYTEGEEDLTSSFPPDGETLDLLPVWNEEIIETVASSWLNYSQDQEK